MKFKHSSTDIIKKHQRRKKDQNSLVAILRNLENKLDIAEMFNNMSFGKKNLKFEANESSKQMKLV